MSRKDCCKVGGAERLATPLVHRSPSLLKHHYYLLHRAEKQRSGGRAFPLACPRLILPLPSSSPLFSSCSPSDPSSIIKFFLPAACNCRCAVVLCSFESFPPCSASFEFAQRTNCSTLTHGAFSLGNGQKSHAHSFLLSLSLSLSLPRALALSRSHSHSLFRLIQSMQGTNRRFLFRLLSVHQPLATMQFRLGNGQKTSHTDFFFFFTV